MGGKEGGRGFSFTLVEVGGEALHQGSQGRGVKITHRCSEDWREGGGRGGGGWERGWREGGVMSGEEASRIRGRDGGTEGGTYLFVGPYGEDNPRREHRPGRCV